MSPTRRSKPPAAAAAAASSSAPPPPIVTTRRRTTSKDKVSSAADYIRSVMEQLQKSSSSPPPPDFLLPVPTSSAGRNIPQQHASPTAHLLSALPQPPPRGARKSAKMSRKPNHRPSCNNNDNNASFGSCTTTTTTTTDVLNPSGQQVWLMIVERMREEIIKARDMHRADLMMSAEKKKLQQQQRNTSRKTKKKRMKVGLQSSQRRQPSSVEDDDDDDDDDDEADGDSRPPAMKLCTVCCQDPTTAPATTAAAPPADPCSNIADPTEISRRRAVAVTVCGHFLCWPCLCRWHNNREQQIKPNAHNYGGSANPAMSFSSTKKECPCCKKILSKNQVAFLGADKDGDDDDDDGEEEAQEEEVDGDDTAFSSSSSSRRRRGRSRAASMAALATDQRDKLLQAAALPILASTVLNQYCNSASRSIDIYDAIGSDLHTSTSRQNVVADSVITSGDDDAAEDLANINNIMQANNSVSLAATMCPSSSVRKRSSTSSVSRPPSACQDPLAAANRDVGRDREKASSSSCRLDDVINRSAVAVESAVRWCGDISSVSPRDPIQLYDSRPKPKSWEVRSTPPLLDHMITDSVNHVVNDKDVRAINASPPLTKMESDHGALVLCCRSSDIEDNDDDHRDFEVISMAPTTSVQSMSSPSTAVVVVVAEDHQDPMISPQHHHHHHPTAQSPLAIHSQYSRPNIPDSQSPELPLNLQISSEVEEDHVINSCRLQPYEGVCSVTTAERQVFFSSGDGDVLLQDNSKTSHNQQATAKYSSAMIVRPDVLLDELGGNYSSYDMNLYRLYHINDSFDGCAAAVESFCCAAATTEENNNIDLRGSTCFSTKSADQENSVIASLEGSYSSSSIWLSVVDPSSVNYNATSLFLSGNHLNMNPSHFVDDFSSNLNDVDRAQLINQSITQLHSYYSPAPYDPPHTPYVQQIYDSMQAATSRIPAVSFTATNYTTSMTSSDDSIFNAVNVISPLSAASRSALPYLNDGQPYAHDRSTLSSAAASTRSSSINQILSAAHVDDALSDWSFMQQYNDWDWTQIASAGIFP